MEGKEENTLKRKLEDSPLPETTTTITLAKTQDNIHNKKLLILDLNGVLIRKSGKTKAFTLRPHVHTFLAHMAGLFHLAVWTSGRADTMHKAMLALFKSDSYKDKLIFYWTQKECTFIPAQTTPEELAILLLPPKPRKKRKKDKKSCSNVNMDVNVNKMKADTLDQNWDALDGSFKKVLSHVFARYPSFSCENTVLVDDSLEKHELNPPHTFICPRPFLPTQHTIGLSSTSGHVSNRGGDSGNGLATQSEEGRRKSQDAVSVSASGPFSLPLSSSSATSATASLSSSTTISTSHSNKQPTSTASAMNDTTAYDDELKPGGRFWNYLVALAEHNGPSNGFIRNNIYQYA